MGIMNNYFPKSKEIEIIDRNEDKVEITVRFLVMDEWEELIDEVTQVIVQVFTSDKAENVDLENFTPDQIGIFVPVLKQIRPIVAMSINKSEEWVGQNVNLPDLAKLIYTFIEVNGFDVISEYFKAAKGLLRTKIEKQDGQSPETEMPSEA